MTYGEIYDEICLNCWPGVAAIPETMPAFLRNKIRSAQRMINRDYNFWFLITTTTIATVAGTQAYNLPTDFKEIEKAWFTVYLQNYGKPVLTQIDIADHIDRGYQVSDSQVEYPEVFRIDGLQLHLYPLPSDVRTLNLLYWQFLELVDITVVATFEAYEDAISIYCGEAIVYYVTSLVKLQQDEVAAAQAYRQLYVEAIQGAMQEDKRRRAIPETIAPAGSITDGSDYYGNN